MLLMEQIPDAILGDGLQSMNLVLIYQNVHHVVCKSKHLPPWQICHDSNIQDGLQDGCQS